MLPALYEQSWSLQGEEVLDIKLITTVLAKAAEMIAYVRDTT